jgi:hypothetical protein
MLQAIHYWSCYLLAGFCAVMLLGNWLSLIGTVKTREPTSLAFPFVAGPMCAAACFFSPSQALQSWWWVPLMADASLVCFACFGIYSLGSRFGLWGKAKSGPEA